MQRFKEMHQARQNDHVKLKKNQMMNAMLKNIKVPPAVFKGNVMVSQVVPTLKTINTNLAWGT